MGAVTGRWHIVCTAAARVLVNDTLRSIESSGTGDPITVALRLATAPNAVASNGVAFGGSWATEEGTRQAINLAIRDAGWSPRPSPAERNVYDRTTAPPAFDSGQRVWVFEGADDNPNAMTFDEAITALGLKRPYDPGPGAV